MGDNQKCTLRVGFDRRLKLEFHGAKVTSDGGLLLYRELPPPVTPLMVIRLFEGEGIKKDWVPLSKISPTVVRAP